MQCDSFLCLGANFNLEPRTFMEDLRKSSLAIILAFRNPEYRVSRRTGRDIWDIIKREEHYFLEHLFPSSRITELENYSPEIEEILYGSDFLSSMEHDLAYNVSEIASFWSDRSENIFFEDDLEVFQRIGQKLK